MTGLAIATGLVAIVTAIPANIKCESFILVEIKHGYSKPLYWGRGVVIAMLLNMLANPEPSPTLSN